MIPLEAVQAAAEVAKQGPSITMQIPIAGASSFLTVLILKLAEAFIARRRNGRGKANGNCAKPGEADECREHGQAIAMLIEAKENAAEALKRIEGKVDTILTRGVR